MIMAIAPIPTTTSLHCHQCRSWTLFRSCDRYHPPTSVVSTCIMDISQPSHPCTYLPQDELHDVYGAENTSSTPSFSLTNPGLTTSSLLRSRRMRSRSNGGDDRTRRTTASTPSGQKKYPPRTLRLLKNATTPFLHASRHYGVNSRLIPRSQRRLGSSTILYSVSLRGSIV